MCNAGSTIPNRSTHRGGGSGTGRPSIAVASARSKALAMPYWACARLEPRREALAAHCLGLAGFTVYTPRLREQRVLRGRRVEVNPPLFPGYCFVAIVLLWHAARWCPGVVRL